MRSDSTNGNNVAGENEYTPQQKRKLNICKGIIAVELVVILILVAARWFCGGWWITWNTGRAVESSAENNSNGSENTFKAPDFDPAAVDGVPDVDESLGWSELTIDDGYVVHVCGVLTADADGSLPVWFASDADNKVWTKLRVQNAEGKTIGETGLLKPGQYVERLQLADSAVSGEVTLQVMGYEPDTYYSAGSVGLATALTIENE